MPITVTMPALSPTMEEGTLAKWLKSEGEEIVAGDVIAEIETDKATMEIEAVNDGILAKIIVPEGTEGVAVNSVIAEIIENDESSQTTKFSQNNNEILPEVIEEVSIDNDLEGTRATVGYDTALNTVSDAIDKIRAGADLIQIYTGFIYEGPSLIKSINKALAQVN